MIKKTLLILIFILMTSSIPFLSKNQKIYIQPMGHVPQDKQITDLCAQPARLQINSDAGRDRVHHQAGEYKQDKKTIRLGIRPCLRNGIPSKIAYTVYLFAKPLRVWQY
jgi:hypothetical protein